MKGILALGGAYLLIALGLVMLGLSILHQFERATDTLQDVTVSKVALVVGPSKPTGADYQVCAPIVGAPLIDRSQGKYDYRLGRGRRDGGIS